VAPPLYRSMCVVAPRFRLVPGHLDPLGGGAAPHTQLQILVWTEGLHYPMAALTDHQEGPNVGCPDLGLETRTLGLDRQAVEAPPLTTRRGAICECSGNVVQLSLVQELVSALTHVLKDDGDLWEGAGPAAGSGGCSVSMVTMCVASAPSADSQRL
uniref:Uncharacterized protein n=1 Tax=Echeneis naucrates TaxID=173247 RepID=A0A665SYX4_ECHNA